MSPSAPVSVGHIGICAASIATGLSLGASRHDKVIDAAIAALVLVTIGTLAASTFYILERPVWYTCAAMSVATFLFGLDYSVDDARRANVRATLTNWARFLRM